MATNTAPAPRLVSLETAKKQLLNNEWTCDKPRSIGNGFSMVNFKCGGKSIKVQFCKSNSSLRFPTGIWDALVDESKKPADGSEAIPEDKERRTAPFTLLQEQEEFLNLVNEWAEKQIKDNFLVWKLPEVDRPPMMRKYLESQGLNPDDITPDEIKLANTRKPQTFGSHLVIKPDAAKLAENPNLKNSTWCKINVKEYKNNPPAEIWLLYTDKNGKKRMAPLDYHEIEKKGFNGIPIGTLVGAMFKGPRWGILLSLDQLYVLPEEKKTERNSLLMEDGEEAPQISNGNDDEEEASGGQGGQNSSNQSSVKNNDNNQAAAHAASQAAQALAQEQQHQQAEHNDGGDVNDFA